MVGLLSMSGNKVDSEYIRQLNICLTQARAEVQELTTKLVRMQSSGSDPAASFKYSTATDADGSPDAEDYGYLKLMLTKSR